jgi:predicted PP-loop superfamily ATPase
MRKIICDRCDSEIASDVNIAVVSFSGNEILSQIPEFGIEGNPLERRFELCGRCVRDLFNRITKYESEAQRERV